jgi:hypothetical protein
VGTFNPNVVIVWLTSLFRIWEVLGSNFGLQTGYPDGGLRGFSFSPSRKWWDGDFS